MGLIIRLGWPMKIPNVKLHHSNILRSEQLIGHVKESCRLLQDHKMAVLLRFQEYIVVMMHWCAHKLDIRAAP